MMHRIRFKKAATSGGGGGTTTNNQWVSFFEKQGPTYATGGFVLDFTSTYSSINDCKLLIKKGFRDSVPAGRLEYALNSPSAGKITIKVMKYQYDQATSVGNVANQPSGVTVQVASGVATSSESSHTHGINHDHNAATSAAATNTGAAVNASLIVVSQNVGSHTHSVDIPAFTGTSGAGSSHNHVDNNLFQHSHTNNYTDTNVSIVEVANATNLTAAVWYGCITGVRA